jgi:hypothetical protein
MREKVRTRQYVMTLHADDEMDADGLSIYDVENVILTGNVFERQTDRHSRESKYLVRGRPLEGEGSVVVVCKLRSPGTLVILTVYLE